MVKEIIVSGSSVASSVGFVFSKVAEECLCVHRDLFSIVTFSNFSFI